MTKQEFTEFKEWAECSDLSAIEEVLGPERDIFNYVKKQFALHIESLTQKGHEASDWKTQEATSRAMRDSYSKFVKSSPKKGNCPRCSGTGKVGNFSHVKNGMCFKCNGTGGAK